MRDPFAQVHAARHRRRAAGVLALVAVAGTGVAIWALSASAAPIRLPLDTVAIAAPQVEVTALPSPLTQDPRPTPTASAPAPQTPPPTITPAAAPLALTASTDYSISITATGYQTELDACQWVRMDLGAAAPIVGAHNDCGGGIVLDMVDGQTVTLSGTALDGTYVVAGSREARAGDSAAGATSGMAADVILQTCFWGGEGRVRLVELVRV